MDSTFLTKTIANDGGKWRRYPAYKDSGVEWLGEIPVGWAVKRLKYAAKINMGQSPSSEDCNQEEIGTPFLQGNAEFGVQHPIPRLWCDRANKHANHHDILLSVRAPVGELNLADQVYGIGRGLCAITPSNTINQDYLWYGLQVFREELASVSTGSTYDAVTIDEVSNLSILIPPKEQHAIAAFLDRETAKIDALIEKKRRLISLLEEKRAAVISHAVTKGLDPNAPMKDSGVEWLGEISAGWIIEPLKHAVKINPEVLSEKTDPSYTFKYIDIGNVSLGEVVSEPGEISFKDSPSRARRIIRSGDVIVSTVRTYLRAITHFVDPEPDLIVSTGFAVLRSTSLVYPRYLYYEIRSNQFIDAIMAHSEGIGYPAINSSVFGVLPFCIPPLVEQHAITASLDRETMRIGALISKIHEAIKKLQEYRTALISAAVTGKIDVREEAKEGGIV